MYSYHCSFDARFMDITNRGVDEEIRAPAYQHQLTDGYCSDIPEGSHAHQLLKHKMSHGNVCLILRIDF